MRTQIVVKKRTIVPLFFVLAVLVGCAAAESSDQETLGSDNPFRIELPSLNEVELNEDEKLRVLTTTAIIGDVLSQVGGEQIDLTILMASGQDPHSFEPSAGDLAAASNAQVIFVNGWALEERLIQALANTVKETPIVSISAGITPLLRGGSDENGGDSAEGTNQAVDPHVWIDPHLVKQWARNSYTILSTLDPANAPAYEDNLASYSEQLEELVSYFDEQVGGIPSEARKLVTNHDSLAYFASAYDFKVIGTIIPAGSTLAEPSASALARLISDMEEFGVCAIFSESTVSDDLAQTAAKELDNCNEVQVITLYTGALGPEESGAGNYIDMMRANISAIVKGICPSKC